MVVQSLKTIKKQMKKLEKLYDKTPEKCVLARFRIEKKMQKLIDREESIKR